MTPSKELFQKLIIKSKYSSDEYCVKFAEFLANEFSKIQAIEQRLLNNKKERQILDKDYGDKSKKNNDEKRKIQNECEHLLTIHYNDPSGGSDSWDECEICGAKLNKNEYRRS